MANPRPLASTASASDLTSWLVDWSQKYQYEADDILTGIARPASKTLGFPQLVDVLTWKLDARWRRVRIDELRAHNDAHPTSISSATNAAATATDDAAALAALLPIPGMKNPSAAAVRSAVLMVINPDRWTPIDRMANASLVTLRDLLAQQAKDSSAPLHELAALLSNYQPSANAASDYLATSADWPLYVACCREISRVTWLSLRTVDRALYGARGR